MCCIDGYWVEHTSAWEIPGTEDLKPYITAKDKGKKWLFGTNLIVHANQYLSMNSTVRLVLEIAIHCLVIYQTYVLWIKRQNATDIS